MCFILILQPTSSWELIYNYNSKIFLCILLLLTVHKVTRNRAQPTVKSQQSAQKNEKFEAYRREYHHTHLKAGDTIQPWGTEESQQLSHAIHESGKHSFLAGRSRSECLRAPSLWSK